MAEKLEDLNLPQASVLKIIKGSVPDNVNIGKDVKSALSKAASMFILYITTHSSQIAQEANRKTLTAQDVLDALKEAEFDNFIEPLSNSLKRLKETKIKKDNKPKKDDEEEMEEDCD
ncbi:PREDICTED: DNA polymerase epsilon subunit 3 [Nicrophorus vespilloides]|uniref:DNA polymerase epsilon subunit 3 n=1 Tax=Nicrophorus vespilloides TaxID=110193 RepID=A0ABM1N030_NICVS|nr:PREDICTED: DNA polymerase epsilon subunit 3 [Nicrophorus vespilloides]